MSDYDNSNRGSLWVNDKKETPTHPDYRGSCEVGGVEYWVSAWASDGSNPKAPVLKFQVTAKDATAQAGIAQTKQATGIGVQPVQGQVASGGGVDFSKRLKSAQSPAAESAAMAMPFEEDSDIPF